MLKIKKLLYTINIFKCKKNTNLKKYKFFIKKFKIHFILVSYCYIYLNMYYKFNVYIYTDIINKYINTKMNSLYIKNYKLKPILLSNVNNLNAAFISNLICIRLKQNLTLSFVLKNIIKIINNITGILSYRIITTGKFTKKQRSTYIINNSKSVIEIPNSSKTEYIDYSTSVATTRYGICNIKVWLVYKMNYNIEELFKINLKKKNTFLNKNVI